MNKKVQLELFEDASKTGDSLSHTKESFFLYIDGASRGNPGPAGAGVCIIHKDKILLKTEGYLGIKTNNQAEYLALALGLFTLKDLITTKTNNITIRSDSLLLISQMNGKYAIKNPFIKTLHPLIQKLKMGLSCTFEHVPREQNSIADEQANKGIDNKTALPESFKTLISNI